MRVHLSSNTKGVQNNLCHPNFDENYHYVDPLVTSPSHDIFSNQPILGATATRDQFSPAWSPINYKSQQQAVNIVDNGLRNVWNPDASVISSPWNPNSQAFAQSLTPVTPGFSQHFRPALTPTDYPSVNSGTWGNGQFDPTPPASWHWCLQQFRLCTQ